MAQIIKQSSGNVRILRNGRSTYLPPQAILATNNSVPNSLQITSNGAEFIIPYAEITAPTSADLQDLINILQSDFFTATPTNVMPPTSPIAGLALFGTQSVVGSFNTLRAGSHSYGLNPRDFSLFLANGATIGIARNGNNQADGAISILSGTADNARFYGHVNEYLKYDVGDASFGKYTVSFGNLDSANGDFDALMGFSLNGIGDDIDKIKEGQLWGYSRRNGVTKAIFRTYKNFAITQETEISPENLPSDPENLHIFIQVFGYLGVHPAILYRVEQSNLSIKTAHFETYASNMTSIQNPNMALTILLENLGNTAELEMRNGSWAQGNINNRMQLSDPSARLAMFGFDRASTPTSGSNETPILAFRMPENVEMYSSFDGTTFTSETFRNAISNRILALVASASNTRVVQLKIYDVSAVLLAGASVWRKIAPFYNFLEYAQNDGVDTDLQNPAFLPADQIGSPLSITFTNTSPASINFRDQFNTLVPGNFVVITVSAKDNSVSDLVITIDTADLA